MGPTVELSLVRIAEDPLREGKMNMSKFIKVGLIAAAFTVALGAIGAEAADLGSDWHGSMKDEPMPAASSRFCYIRGDMGYSWYRDVDARYIGNYDPAGNLYENFDKVRFQDGWFAEGGFGCGFSRGIYGGLKDEVVAGGGVRWDVIYGHRFDRDFSGDIPINTNPDDPIETTVSTNTLLFNMYYDFANWRGLTPYVGVGVGVAWHDMDWVTSTDPTSPNPQFGDRDRDFAWALMAGMSYAVSQNVALDFGYRYIDMGSVDSKHEDVLGFWNPRLALDDISAHELKVGLRVSFNDLFSRRETQDSFK